MHNSNIHGTSRKPLTLSVGLALLAVVLVGCVGQADTVDPPVEEAQVENTPQPIDRNVDGDTETGIIDAIEEEAPVFDVAEELGEVYNNDSTSLAVNGTEERKSGGLNADGLVAPGIDEGQEEAGIDPDSLLNQAAEPVEVEEAPEVIEPVAAAGNGSFEAYSAERVAAAAENGKVVLFFHAAWCHTCRGLESSINANIAALPSDVTILKVDYDSALELRQKYGITIQHTLVQVDGNGEQITKWTGGNSIESITSRLQ